MNEKIFEAGCIGVKNGDGNENIKLFISKVPGKNLNVEELKADSIEKLVIGKDGSMGTTVIKIGRASCRERV